MGATGDGLEWQTYDFSKVTAVALFTKSDELGLQPDLLCAAHKHNTRDDDVLLVQSFQPKLLPLIHLKRRVNYVLCVSVQRAAFGLLQFFGCT